MKRHQKNKKKICASHTFNKFTYVVHFKAAIKNQISPPPPLTKVQVAPLNENLRKRINFFSIYFSINLKKRIIKIRISVVTCVELRNQRTSSSSSSFISFLFIQGIRIKGMEMVLVWREKASRIALETGSLFLAHAPETLSY